MLTRNRSFFSVLVLIAVVRVASPTFGDDAKHTALVERLKAAYPEDITGADGNGLIFKDGTRLDLDDDRKSKPFADWLAHPSISNMFRYPYPAIAPALAPAENFDPGRARNAGFFTKIYGDCRKPSFAASLTTIVWLPKKSGQRVTVSRNNGVARQLQAASNELDALPPKFNAYLIPSAGGYMCRPIAGTDQRSAHGYGIAIDIATRHSHYWRWRKKGHGGYLVYRNEIPMEIVRIFEKHGFIWGGRWYHYDTMHFEYRPELLTPNE